MRLIKTIRKESKCSYLTSYYCHAFDHFSEEVARGTGLIDKVTSDKRSLAQMHLSEYSDRDSGNYMDVCKYDQF